MGYYPIDLDLEGAKVLVVGGGAVAERKISSLFKAGAKITVISPKLSPGLKELLGEAKIDWIEREYRAGDLKGAVLIISATDDFAVNAAVSKEAQEESILINVVDDPALSNFIVPSVLKRGDLSITVSTGGIAPALSKKIRGDLEILFDEGYGDYLAFLKEIRIKIKESHPFEPERAKAWERIAAIDVDAILKNGGLESLKETVKRCI